MELTALPAGVKLTGRRAAEKRDPRAKGVEAYAPAHDYEIEGGGTVDVTYPIAFAPG